VEKSQHYTEWLIVVLSAHFPALPRFGCPIFAVFAVSQLFSTIMSHHTIVLRQLIQFSRGHIVAARRLWCYEADAPRREKEGCLQTKPHHRIQRCQQNAPHHSPLLTPQHPPNINRCSLHSQGISVIILARSLGSIVEDVPLFFYPDDDDHYMTMKKSIIMTDGGWMYSVSRLPHANTL
jgi:hypothetical protein